MEAFAEVCSAEPGVSQFMVEDSLYQVKLDIFEGPLDLLLHLIKKNELNIYNIPIALITQQYLEYIELMKSLNLNVAGEFIMMVATLIYIKSKMLLPSPETEEEEEEKEDPRAYLVRHLLEYKRFKDAGEELGIRESIWRDIYSREEEIDIEDDGDDDTPIYYDVSLFDLLDALRGLLERIPEKKGLEISIETLSVKDKISSIIDRLEEEENITFISLFEGERTKMAVIVTFLALLELIRLRVIRITQMVEFGQIRIYKNE